MTVYKFVDLTVDDSALHAIAGETRIGVDTEFMRERTYFAELCLLQLSTRSEIFCADPIGGRGDGAPAPAFWESVLKPEWVVHSARQDIEVIFQGSGRMPAAIFDTQIAAALLGFMPQIGYGGLVKALFDVELDKSHTRADWTRRPLSDALLQYAAEDVQYLLPAYEELAARLDKVGRLEWAIEDSRALVDPLLYETDPTLAIHRLKAARNLQGRARAAAMALSEWRETEALRLNRPRQWILRDAVLVEIAATAPDSEGALAQIEDLPEKTRHRSGRTLLEIVAAAQHDTSGYRPPPRPDEKQKASLREMQRLVSARADDLGIAAELVAPRKELAAAMLGERNLRVFSGWRRGVVGEMLLGVLDR